MKHIHHIIPKHMGGTDDPSNLIELTIEEHAEAHKKLYEQYGSEYDRIAWLALSKQINLTEAKRLAHLEGAKQGAKMIPHEVRVANGKNTPIEQLSRAGKIGGKSCYEQRKGMFKMTKEERIELSKKTINSRWICTETGFISNAAGVAKYQKARGIDTHKRKRVT